MIPQLIGKIISEYKINSLILNSFNSFIFITFKYCEARAACNYILNSTRPLVLLSPERSCQKCT